MSDVDNPPAEQLAPATEPTPATVAAPAATVKKLPKAAWSEIQWAVVLVWPLVLFAGLYVLLNQQNTKIRAEQASRPPIAVIDVTRTIQDNLGPNATEADMQRALLKSTQAAEKLQGAGYLVFRAHDVYAYPAAVEAKP